VVNCREHQSGEPRPRSPPFKLACDGLPPPEGTVGNRVGRSETGFTEVFFCTRFQNTDAERQRYSSSGLTNSCSWCKRPERISNRHLNPLSQKNGYLKHIAYLQWRATNQCVSLYSIESRASVYGVSAPRALTTHLNMDYYPRLDGSQI